MKIVTICTQCSKNSKNTDPIYSLKMARWVSPRPNKTKHKKTSKWPSIKDTLDYFIWMSVLPASISVHPMHLWRPEENIGSPGSGVMYVWKLPRGCLDLNLGPPGKYPELLTTVPSLQVPVLNLKSWVSGKGLWSKRVSLATLEIPKDKGHKSCLPLFFA